MQQRLAASAAVLAVIASTAAVQTPQNGPIPDEMPDVGPVLSEPILRGAIVLQERTDRAPVEKVIDGDASDWVAEPARVGGATVWGHGELVYSDFLFDAHGADDGGDAERLEQFADLLYTDERTWRVDQVLRTSGSQLGVPEPVGAPDEYGDVDAGLDVADLTEVRWALAADGASLQLLASVANLTDPASLAVLVLADTVPDGGGDVGLGTVLTSQRYDRAVLLRDGVAHSRDLRTGGQRALSSATVAVSADGWDNHLEAAVPAALLVGDAPDGAAMDVAVVAGRVQDDGSFTPLNVAYRPMEPVEIFSDRLQALDLLAGSVDRFSTGPIALTDLADGRHQPMAHPGPGYHERRFRSDPAISREGGDDGIQQPYGLFVPSGWDPAAEAPTPATYWLHYRGGKAHSGTVINPRLTRQLGEDRDNVVIFPHARGTSEWYVTEAHQDFFEVMADAESLIAIDPLRRYVSGYSMGGYGSWLLATLYPDLFAAAFVQSGAVTQGAWVGSDHTGAPDPLMGEGYIEANDGDARRQLTYHALESLRHVPFAIDHGTDDELVPVTAIERMAARLTSLGYQHRFTRLLGYEHFSQAVVDEWADGAAYLDRFVLDPNPRRVTYAHVPALVWAVNETDPVNDAGFDFAPDGAYWVDDVRLWQQDVDEHGRPQPGQKGVVDVIAEAIPAPATVPIVDTGAASPPGHSTPYLRSGLALLETPVGGEAIAPRVRNGISVGTSRVRSVTIAADRARLDLGQTWHLALSPSEPGLDVRLAGALDGTGRTADEVASWSRQLDSAGWSGGVTFRADGDDVVVTYDGTEPVELTIG